MKNNYIPEIFKEKFILFINYFYGLFLLLLSILSCLALFTFDINDNSLLTSTSRASENLLGTIGSYFASFIFYTFGIMGYLIIIFFLSYSILIFLKKKPKYIFIRLLVFFLSLILIPQTIIDFNFEISFVDSIEIWGVFAIGIHNLHDLSYINYISTIIGLILFLVSQDLIYLLKIPKVSFINLFKREKNDGSLNIKIRKEPLINNSTKDEIDIDINQYENLEEEANEFKPDYFSPSLEILDNKDQPINKKIDKEKIKVNSELLEKVFDESDSIDIQDDFVRNVKYVAGHEGYDGTAYVDGTGKNATISLGAGLNVKFITDAQMAMISSKGQQAIKEIRQLMKTDMSLERIAEAIDEKYGTIIKKTESDAIFTAKMTENYKQFVKDFPNFALVSVEKQMAMLDHAYQMGYGEGEFVEYWRNITKALNTTNPEHRAFYFQRAGSHLIYNYEKDDQNIFDGNFVTGRTILSTQTEDRVFDRASLFGFHADARTPFFKRKAKQIYKAVTK